MSHNQQKNNEKNDIGNGDVGNPASICKGKESG